MLDDNFLAYTMHHFMQSHTKATWLPFTIAATKQALARECLDCVSKVFYGKHHGVPRLLHEGAWEYGHLLKRLQSSLESSKCDQDTVVAVVILGLFEV